MFSMLSAATCNCTISLLLLLSVKASSKSIDSSYLVYVEGVKTAKVIC